MKKLLMLVSIFSVISIVAFGQVPGAFNYQSVIRNSNGDIISNQEVTFRISILQNSENGSNAYSEIHSATTNSFGLVNLKIGQGTRISGNFDPANWGTKLHFLKLEIDLNGGNNYQLLGTTQLLSVPYAFHAKTVETDNVEDADADATNEIQTLNLSGTRLSLSNGGGTVTLPSSGGGDNWGTQTVVHNATLTGEGTSACPLGVTGDLTDDQTLSINGYQLSISDGNTVNLPYEQVFWKQKGLNLYYNTGNIGIGTDSPQNQLEIYEPYSTNAVAKFKSVNGNAILELERGDWLGKAYTAYKNGGSATFYSGLLGLGNNDFSLTFDNSTLKGIKISQSGDTYLSGNFYTESSKKVGIGTTAPTDLLTINGGEEPVWMRLVNNFWGTTANDGLHIGLTSMGSYFFNNESCPIFFGTSNSYRMTVATNGYVGIGTTTPGAGLHVKGTGYPASFMYLEANTGQDAGMRFYEGTSAKWHIFNNSAAGGLQIYNTAAQTAIFCKQSNSFVGIGTTAPTQALHVVGNAYKTSGGTSWATSSDLRLKNVVGKYEKGLTEISALQPVKYIYKDNNPRQ